jgi:RNA polymerase sigma-70 factor (ECF subfamily)
MHERTAPLAVGFLSVAGEVEREFDARLVESSTLMFRVAYSVLRHRQDAEDVAQEAFVRAHRHFHRLRDRDRFRAWVVRVTWRLALDHLRTVRRRSIREYQHVETMPASTEDAAITAERAEQLWAAIDALPDKLRIVVVLSAIDGHDIREVARLLAVPEGTVKSRLHAARQQLREQLDAR